MNASLIRNLAKASWFGTLRVLEEDKTQVRKLKLEGPEMEADICFQLAGCRDWMGLQSQVELAAGS